MLKSRLPPLEPLIAFEAAARLLSFTRAGEELHLTQAAISQQIRNLEQSLQVKLFTRSHRAVQLTNEGREYQHTVNALLRQLAGATMDIQHSEIQPQLVIASDQSFAAHWLGKRLPELRRLLAGVSLRLVASDDDDECLASDIQFAILHGEGDWPGFSCQRLFEEEVFPVCSPAYEPAASAEDWRQWLPRSQLIDLVDSHWNWMNWRLWMSGHDIDEPLRNRPLQINHYPLVIEAACDGLGVALGWRHLADDLIDQGRLIRPVQESMTTSYGYYLIWRDGVERDEPARLFLDWLRGQFSATAEQA